MCGDELKIWGITMKNIVIKFIGLSLIISIAACDQVELPWDKSATHKLTDEQIRTRITLQQEMADLQEQLKRVQPIIDQSKERLSDIRLEYSDKFISETIQVGENPPLGLEQAPIAMVEFTDYQCPNCARHVAEVIPLLKRYYIDTGKLKYFTRDFPLAIHSQAKYAAVVALCAGKQGRYWQMYDLLFKNQKRLNPRLYLGLSHDLGLDPQMMSDCLINNDSVKKVDAETFYGQSIGVSSTPKFFVGLYDAGEINNVIMIKGAMPYAHFSEILDLLIDLDVVKKDMKSAHLEKVAIKREIMRLEGELSAFR